MGNILRRCPGNYLYTQYQYKSIWKCLLWHLIVGGAAQMTSETFLITLPQYSGHENKCCKSSDDTVCFLHYCIYSRGPEEKSKIIVLKSKDQVTLFVNCSYNSFYWLNSSEINKGVVAHATGIQMMSFYIYIYIYMYLDRSGIETTPASNADWKRLHLSGDFT